MEPKKIGTFKDKLEIVEAVCTILVSVVALWGTAAASRRDLWHKMAHIIEHYHAEIVQQEDVLSGHKE